MPLRAIECESAGLRRKGQAGKPVPVDDCLACSLTRDNDCGYSHETLKVLLGSQQERGDNISSTALLTECVRSEVLKRRHPFSVAPTKLWAAFLGTLAHSLGEAELGPDAYGELRFWAPVPWPIRDGGPPGEDFISCKPDKVTLHDGEGILWDTKSSFKKARKETGIFGRPYSGHGQQLNINAYVISHAVGVGEAPKLPAKSGDYGTTYQASPEWEDPARFKPEEWVDLRIEYLTEDGATTMSVTRREYGTNKDGSQSKRASQVPDIWTEQEAERFIKPRYFALREGMRAYPERVPAVPAGLETMTGFPCDWCEVRKECIRLRVEEGR